MKKLLIAVALGSPVLILLVAFNYAVDPARLFRSSDRERRMVDALDRGAFITKFADNNFNDRAFQRLLIESRRAPSAIGVMGSSRVMMISSELFPGKTLLNNGLSAASLPDLISEYEIYREHRTLPGTMIIGVDAWIFNRNNTLVAWRQFGEHYYSQFLKRDSASSFTTHLFPREFVPYQYQELVSPGYFQAGLESLWTARSAPKQEFATTESRFNEDYTIGPDASRTWTAAERDATPPAVDTTVRREITDPRYVVNFAELDPELTAKFSALVRAMKADGVHVVFYLPPYHPLMYDFYSHADAHRMVLEAERFVRQVAATERVDVVGAYDPAQLGIPASAFVDSLHLRNESDLRAIFRDLSIR